MKLSRRVVERIFAMADVAIDGNRPWDIRVANERFFGKVLLHGSLGLGETYMEKWWTCDDLEELFFRLINARLERISRGLPFTAIGRAIDSTINQQSKFKSRRVAERHYNMGNDLFLEFLGGRKNYSGAFYEDGDTLEQAQIRKMEMICRGLELNERDRLLDVGGGWGEVARYAAANYGCHVTSINISDEQIRHATGYCRDVPVEVRKCDYRDLTGTYSKIAVIAMLTHVGPKNYRTFMEIMHRSLEPGGIMLIESVGAEVSRSNCEPWTDRYIFPGGVIPSLRQIDKAVDGLLVRTGVTEFGLSYVHTLRAWHANFMRAWPKLRDNYSDTTRLMFEYFFLSVAGTFRARDLLYWHIVLRNQAPARTPA